MSEAPLFERFRAVVCDLDGVVYHGPTAVPGAPAALRDLGRRLPVVYATNNASRPPSAVAQHLTALGIDTEAASVVTSAVAGARRLAASFEAGSAVLAVGGPGVAQALEQENLRPVAASQIERDDEGVPQNLPRAVLQGYGPDIRAMDLATTAHAVQAGATWVVTNTDRTLPTAAGIAPGNGTLVAAVRAAVDVDPDVVGKPGPAMYELAAEVAQVPAADAVGVGDRLETDTAGARAAGMTAAHVLTGVHGPADVASAPPELRPDLLLQDLAGLLEPYHQVVQVGDRFCCAESAAQVRDTDQPGDVQVEVTGEGITAVRAVVALAWSMVDAGVCDAEAVARLVRSSVGS